MEVKQRAALYALRIRARLDRVEVGDDGVHAALRLKHRRIHRRVPHIASILDRHAAQQRPWYHWHAPLQVQRSRTAQISDQNIIQKQTLTGGRRAGAPGPASARPTSHSRLAIMQPIILVQADWI